MKDKINEKRGRREKGWFVGQSSYEKIWFNFWTNLVVFVFINWFINILDQLSHGFFFLTKNSPIAMSTDYHIDTW
jgi:hypothetical protein